MTVKEYNNAVREFGDHVYRFIYRSIRDSHRAGDIVQDTYEKLWRMCHGDRVCGSKGMALHHSL